MEEFITANNTLMVQGHHFNWERRYEVDDTKITCLFVSFGIFSDLYTGAYYLEEKKLIISRISFDSDFAVKFTCEDLFFAELVILSFISGNNIKLLPIYQK